MSRCYCTQSALFLSGVAQLGIDADCFCDPEDVEAVARAMADVPAEQEFFSVMLGERSASFCQTSKGTKSTTAETFTWEWSKTPYKWIDLDAAMRRNLIAAMQFSASDKKDVGVLCQPKGRQHPLLKQSDE